MAAALGGPPQFEDCWQVHGLDSKSLDRARSGSGIEAPLVVKSKMGIKGYTRWVSDVFSPAFVTKDRGGIVGCDHMYVDINALIHTAVRRAASRGRGVDACVSFLFKLLDDIVAKCPPRKTVTLALDGASDSNPNPDPDPNLI